MSEENRPSRSTGYSFMLILFLIFLFLKLGQFGLVANWSWWWVTSPLWLPSVIVLTLVVIVLIMELILKQINNK